MNEHHLHLAGFAMWVPEIGGFVSWGRLLQQVVAEQFAPGTVPALEPPYPGAVCERSLDLQPFGVHPYESETLQ